ncbi:MAG: hypothetical protein P9M08_00460 [Candidatus Erginobacter occultus]|nr:hypothetical protein [Candidatus Erginobacter occultus]
MSFNRQNQENGFSLIALVIIILILGVVAYTFVGIISTHRLSSIELYNSMKAFYLTEAALEVGKQYLSDEVGGPPAWAPHTVLYSNEPLGDGSYSLTVYWDQASGFFSFTASGEIN